MIFLVSVLWYLVTLNLLSAKNMDYKTTLNLPKTDFSMQARLGELEPRILSYWAKLDVYSLLRKRAGGLPKFILHDGPPYANGDIHIGHALNKILKDFVVKYKFMRGFDVPFVPGWDCHGLPVEHQLFKELGITKHQIDRVEFRKKAREFALKFVHIQRLQFKRLGIIADWQRPYLTLDFAYESEVVRAFARLVQGKYIYRDLKPINWCINCETALAEAEVEYAQRRSPSIYVKFKLPDREILKRLMRNRQFAVRKPVSFLIWTTTPWTLVSNVAIAVHPEFTYSFIEIQGQDNDGEILIMASGLVETVMHQAGIQDFQKLGEVKGKALENINAAHPFLPRKSRLVLADYVSNQEGTGCVHTAPGHGQEDYLTGRKYKLPVIMPVDEKGRFNQSCMDFAGVSVFQANDLIIEKMRANGSLFFAKTILHTYPHCWRCKNPLIIRSTKQWFINVDHRNLRKRALRVIKSVAWVPPAAVERIASMIQARPDWCLSRQRYWGVPIPVFYCRACGQEILQSGLIERFADRVLELGADFWFSEDVAELAGKKLRCPACKGKEFIKEEDIIDVWFDSGLSHQAVLRNREELNFPATLYLEGSDQHRGWFQTALLTSVPLTGQAPYRQVLTHGFVVDGEGKKMSKSRGNVISPQEVISEYGADVLRLWVASCDYTDDVRISPQILQGTANAYRKIRNTLRFLLGNLYDFSAEKKVRYSQLWEIDRWALSILTRFLIEVTEDFEHFLYYKMFRRLYNFCIHQMSAFYLDVLKDRLYTFTQNSLARRSAQTAIYEILIALTKVTSPILSFTTEELWQNLSKILGEEEVKVSIILNRWPKIERKWLNFRLEAKMDRLSKIRHTVLKAMEEERIKGVIHSSLEARVTLFTPNSRLLQFLKKNLDLLNSIFIVSEVLLKKVPADSLPEGTRCADFAQLVVQVERVDFPKCQRCWNLRPSVGKDARHPSLCARCVEVIAQLEKEKPDIR